MLDTAEEAEISDRVAIDIYQWLREVCTTALLNNPMILGGPGTVVQIDESLFRHKPKVHGIYLLHVFLSYQNHRGRCTSTEVWIFGCMSPDPYIPLHRVKGLATCPGLFLLSTGLCRACMPSPVFGAMIHPQLY